MGGDEGKSGNALACVLRLWLHSTLKLEPSKPTPTPSDLNLIEQQRLRENVRRIPSLERAAGLLLQQVHQALNLRVIFSYKSMRYVDATDRGCAKMFRQ